MAIESATFISQLNPSNPDGSTDTVATLDNQDRLIKTCLTNTFTDLRAEVSASAGEMNYLRGATANLQTQINRKAFHDATNTFTAQQFFAAGIRVDQTATFGSDLKVVGRLDVSATAVFHIKQFTHGQHTIFIPADALVSRSTNGPAAGSSETSTNKIMLKSKSYDASTQEYGQVNVQMPKSYDGGTIVGQFVWYAATAAGSVVWSLRAGAFADGDALDTALGTAVNVTDAVASANTARVSAETGAVTIAGSPGAEEWVVFEASREAGTATDSVTTDAELLGLKIHYTTNADTDD